MKPKILLRIASGIILLHAVGHFFGVASLTKDGTDEQNLVIQAMTGHRFPVLGTVHSYADFLNGFGWIGEISLLLTAYLLWLTGSVADSQPGISRKLSAALFVGLLAQSVLEFIYFFPVAYVMTMIATILTGLSFVLTKSKEHY